MTLMMAAAFEGVYGYKETSLFVIAAVEDTWVRAMKMQKTVYQKAKKCLMSDEQNRRRPQVCSASQ
jgi:hypothetical protein